MQSSIIVWNYAEWHSLRANLHSTSNVEWLNRSVKNDDPRISVKLVGFLIPNSLSTPLAKSESFFPVKDV